MDFDVKGSCLCGEVKASIKGPFKAFYQCYCDRCQKKAGNAFASLLFTSADKLTWLSGERNIQRYNLPQAERFSNSFCKTCGSQVPYVGRDGSYMITPAGFLDDDPQIAPTAHIFHNEKPTWLDAGASAPCFEGYPK